MPRYREFGPSLDFRETHHGLAAWIDRRGGEAVNPTATAEDLPEPEPDPAANSDSQAAESKSPISL